MISFLKTILILLLVYYGLKLLFSALKPYFLRFLAKKVNERFGNAFGQNPFQAYETPNEGKVTIDKDPRKKNPSKKVVGEYIDFEELE
ncbi:MAG: DUF4834 family protein [Flavobacteriaceae bacterium]